MEEIAVSEEKKNFDFVDAIRGLAMIGIVFEHSIYGGTYIFEGFSTKHLVYIGLIQLSKFGTISFFILAGFLLGSKFLNYSSWEYFKRRLSSICAPWLIWSSIFIVAILVQRYIVLKNDFNFWKLLLENIQLTFLYTNYWFIINFMFCIGLLLLFKKYLYSWWLGGILLTLTLIYSVNIYFEWFKPSHTIAIFGFVFYLWLGAILNKNWGMVEQKLKKTPYVIFIALTILTFTLSILEITFLFKQQSADPYNTLRISNICYSIMVVLLLLKIKNFGFIKYIKPRETTFGIYLIHYIIVISLLPEIFRPFQLPALQEMSLSTMIVYIICRFVIVYSFTMLIIWLFSKSKLKWVIGR